MTQISAVCVCVNAGQLLSVESSTNLHNQHHHHHLLQQQQQQQQQLKTDDGDGHTDGAAVETPGEDAAAAVRGTEPCLARVSCTCRG